MGTISIAKSETLAAMLKKKGIRHSVLNAKYHEMEAEIVAQAGRYAAVTIATNMAGRGTDIVLGGNPEGLARQALKAKEYTKEEWENTLAQFKAQCVGEKEKVIAAGGLHILGTERHEARRIDNQLRGRSGRQGDPGSSRVTPNTFGGYWKHMDWQKAITDGMAASGLAYSGSYGFVETKMFWRINHMVVPKDQALKCTDCHGPKGRLNWKELGYKGDPRKVGARKAK